LQRIFGASLFRAHGTCLVAANVVLFLHSVQRNSAIKAKQLMVVFLNATVPYITAVTY